MTVWEVKPSANYTDIRGSISSKNRQSGQYETDWNGFVRLIGNAHKDACNLVERSKIKIGDCDVTSNYDKAKKVTYTNYKIFSFEDVTGNVAGQTKSGATTNTDGDGFLDFPEGIGEDLPFN